MALDLTKLNPRQREAVLHAEGPLLILAGAGSGKTSTMAYRIAHLVASRRAKPHEILGLSFTNKAARELKERVGGLIAKSVGTQGTKGLIITTFHSLGVRLLRENAVKLGFQPNFSILDEGDRRDVLRQVLRNIKIDERRFDPDVLAFEFGQAKGRLLKPAESEAYFLESGRLSSEYALAAASAFPRYQEQLRVLNAMDFDDLLYHSVDLLERHADARERYNRRFRYILVDEYQDTNPTQFRILQLLTQTQKNLCVVGDDDQSIYSWRGADPTHILGFDRHFKGARVITLDQNYRSTSTILDAANHVIAQNKKRHPKSLWSERGQGEPLTEVVLQQDRDEAEFVAEEILRRFRAPQPRKLSDFAVLYRSNAQARVFEEALRLQRIPYKVVGGMSFLDRKEVKDVLSYWRVVVNPSDDASLRRVLNWPVRGVGKTTFEALGTYAFANGIPFYEALDQAPTLAPKSAKGVTAFRELIAGLRAKLDALPAEPGALSEWARGSLSVIGVKAAIEAECDDPAQSARRWEIAEELANALGQIRPDDAAAAPATAAEILRDYLNRMMLDAQDREEDAKGDLARDEVTLLTLHGAKGLEFPVVFLVGMEDGFLPHRRVIEEATDLGEERRLCYVGITRAKDHLILTRAKERLRYGKPVPRVPSRFLEEIPPVLIVRRDESHTPDLSRPEARDAHEAKVKNFLADIRARIGAPS